MGFPDRNGRPIVRVAVPLLGLVSGMWCTAAALPAQQSKRHQLKNPVWTLKTSMRRIGATRSLDDGRLLVLDSRAHHVFIVPKAAHGDITAAPMSLAPGLAPIRMFAYRDDTTLLFSESGLSVALVLPDGRVAREISLPFLLGPSGMSQRPNSAAGVDTAGRLYERGFERIHDGAGWRLLDSIPLERWTIAAKKRDTVLFLKRTRVADDRGITALLATTGDVVPFFTIDQWAVAPDGRVARVSLDPYHISFVYPNGHWTIGPHLSVDSIAVDQEMRAEWLREHRQTRSSPNPAGGLRGIELPEPAQWPAFLPPFLEGAARFDDRGVLWIRRTTRAAARPLYDLIDGSGARSGQVVLREGERVVGFGNGVVYVVQQRGEGEVLAAFANNTASARSMSLPSRPFRSPARTDTARKGRQAVPVSRELSDLCATAEVRPSFAAPRCVSPDTTPAPARATRGAAATAPSP